MGIGAHNGCEASVLRGIQNLNRKSPQPSAFADLVLGKVIIPGDLQRLLPASMSL